MAYVQGADAAGNPILFDPETGSIIPAPPAKPPTDPLPPPPPPPRPRDSSGLGRPPDLGTSPGGSCFTTMADIYRWFLQYLGGPPHDDAEAQGYGRVGVPCEQVIAEIANSPEALAFRKSGVPDPARAIKTVPKGRTTPPLTGVPSELQEVISELFAQLSVLTAEVHDEASSIGDAVKAKIAAALGPVLGQINGVRDQVSRLVTDAVAGAPGEVLGLIAGAITATTDLTSSLLQNLANVHDVAGAFTKAIGDRQNPIAEFIVNVLLAGGSGLAYQTIAGAPTEAPRPKPRGDEPPTPVDDLPPEITPPLTMATDPRDPLSAPARSIEIALGALAGMLAFIEPGMELMKQYAWSVAPDKLIDSSTAAQAETRGIVSSAYAEEISLRDGHDGYSHAILRELARAVPDAGTMTEALHRGDVSEQDWSRGLKRLGFDEFSREVLRATARRLLGPEVTARLVDRDRDSAAGSPTFGGQAEISASFVYQGRAAGLLDEDIARLWDAHYAVPDMNLAAELLHRRKIPLEAYRAVLRANALPPIWRQAIEESAYVPYSRRDWLRLVKAKLLDHKGLVAAIEDSGFEPARAEVMAQLFEQLAEQDKSAAKDPTRRSMTTAILNLYRDGARTREVAAALLKKLEWEDDEIESWLTEVDLQREVARIATVTKLVRPFYVDGIWDQMLTSNVLTQADLNESHQAELFAQWDLERLYRAEKPHQAKAHELTAGELKAAFEDRMITEPAYRARLVKIGYSAEDVELEVALSLIRQHKSEQADAVAHIEHLLTTGQIDETKASDALMQAGVSAGKRDKVIDAALRARKAKKVDLTLSQLEQLLGAEIIDEDQAASYVDQMPYTDQEKIWLLSLIGSRAAAAQARAQKAADKAARQAAEAATISG